MPLPFASAHVVPGPCHDAPAEIACASLKIKQNPLLKHDAPMGCGQVVDAQLVLLPLKFPPTFAQSPGLTGPMHAPLGMQHAPAGKQT